MLYDDEIWPLVKNDDLWIFDKLILSRKLGHLCGPSGIDVPCPGMYVVRPCVNIQGMGLGASIQWIEKDSSTLPPGAFWQELFIGRHLSIDFKKGTQIRCSEGKRHNQDLSRFHHWILTTDTPTMPAVIQDIISRYDEVNVEMIDNKIIEVHLRGNPDFDDGAVELIPVWNDEDTKCPNGFVFVENADFCRLGFYKKY